MGVSIGRCVWDNIMGVLREYENGKVISSHGPYVYRDLIYKLNIVI